MKRENLLMVSDSDHNADMLYAVGMFVPDPFIYARVNGRPQIVVSDLEIDRARTEASHCRVVSLSRLQRTLQSNGHKKTGTPQIIAHWLRLQGIRRVTVPDHFPFGLAKALQRQRIKVRPKRGLFFPERALKSADEVKKISAALMMAEVGLAEGIQALKSSKVDRKRRLIYRGNPLTSEKLRAIIDTAIVQAGGLACHTIVAGGRQACDPHERGHGLLRANEPIVLDVFPRSQRTGYFGDITRTVVKGRATDAIRKVYHVIERGQEIAFEKMRHGVSGRAVHEAVQDFFAKEGYRTTRRRGRMQGFFHGTGHGLGLEIHERPRVSISSDRMEAGHVVTVEPGLYYPGVGGVRLEDVVVIRESGNTNLTKFPKVLEI